MSARSKLFSYKMASNKQSARNHSDYTFLSHIADSFRSSMLFDNITNLAEWITIGHGLFFE